MHIIGTNQAGQLTGTFYSHVVIEHFNLNIGAGNVVVAMNNGVNNKLRPTELRELRDGDEETIFAEKRVLADLALYKFRGLLYHIACFFALSFFPVGIAMCRVLLYVVGGEK